LVTYIPKADLIVGKQYRCLARNFEVGTWNGTGFDYLRCKFGHKFMDIEYHYDDGAPYGTVKPLEIFE
jgi:hypothetical protein